MSHTRKSVLVIGLAVGTVLLAVLALRHVSGEGQAQTHNDPSYVCGRFGDKVMRIDSRYLFLSRVEYQDVDYWTGNKADHDSKGCDDEIQSAAFDVEWPAMTPSNSFRNLGKVDFVRFSLHQRSMWNIEKRGESKDFFDETPILLNYSMTNWNNFESKRSIDEINSIKEFNSALDLYEMSGYDDEKSRSVAYWQEIEGKGVSLTIRCVYYKLVDEPACQYSTHIPDYGHNTSYLKIYFHADLLPHWKELHRDALQLIDRFTVKGNGE